MAINKNFVVKNGLEVNGNLLFANPDTNKVGLGTTAPQYELDVLGNISAETFLSETISISSQATTSNLNVSGISTFQNGYEVTGGDSYYSDDVRLYFGTLSNKNSFIGYQSTPEPATYFQSFNNLPLTFYSDDITLGSQNGENYAVFLSNGSASLYYDNNKKFETLGTGITVTGTTFTDQLSVSGISTFVGYSTFRDYVNIENGLNVTGISTFVGFSTFRDYVNIVEGLNIIGVSTFAGITTVTGETLFAQQFSVSGVSTHVGVSTFESTLFANQLSVSGISTLGVTTTTYLSAQQFSVSGVSTAQYYDIRDIGIVGSAGTDLAITANYDLILLTDAATSGFSGPLWTFGKDGTLTSPGLINADKVNVTGISTLGIVTASNIYSSGIITSSGFVGNLTGNLNSSGVNTATTISGSDLTYTSGNLTTVNIITGIVTTLSGTNINYSGIGTLSTLESTIGTITNLSGTNGNFSGITTSSILNVGTGGTIITTTSSGSVGLGTINPESKLSVVGGDISVGIDTSHGVVLTSPNGTKYRLIVDNSGNITSTPV